MHKKHKIYNRTTLRNQQKHTYSIVSGQSWQSTRHIVTGRIVECDLRIQLFKLRII